MPGCPSPPKLLVALAALASIALALPWLLPRPGLDGTIPERPFPDSRFDEVEGVRLHWRERGSERAGERAALVVLVHGFGGSAFSWRHTLDSLEASGYAAIAPDLPPFGYSERAAEGPDWVSLVHALIDRSGSGGPLVLVGHSMGARVAAEVAARIPARVRKLILVDGTPDLGGAPRAFAWALSIPSVGRAAEVFAAWRLLDRRALRGLLASAFGRAPTDEELAGYTAPLTVPGTYPALLRRMAARTRASAGDLPVPTAVVWGERDEWVPVAHAERLVERRPEAGPIRIVPGAGHNPMETHPEAFHALLLELIGGG